MKSNYFLIGIACLIVSCKNSHKSKDADTKEIENLYFSKDDFTKVKPSKHNYSNSFTLNKDEFLNIFSYLKSHHGRNL